MALIAIIKLISWLLAILTISSIVMTLIVAYAATNYTKHYYRGASEEEINTLNK